MDIKHIPITDLKLDDSNPNFMSAKQKAALHESISRYGMVQPLVIDKDNTCINGNQKLAILQDDPELAKMLKGKAPCVIMSDLSPSERALLQQALNKIRGEHDRSKDAAIFEKLLDSNKGDTLATLLGKKTDTLAKMIERTKARDEGKTALDDIPKACQLGQHWKLGRHMLYVGDWKDSGFHNETIHLLLTDPPYGINVVNVKTGSTGNMPGQLAPRTQTATHKGTVGNMPACGEKYMGPTATRKGGDKVEFRATPRQNYAPVHGDDAPFDPMPIHALNVPTILFGANHYHDKLPLGQWLVWIKKASVNFRMFNTSDCELAWFNSKTARAVKAYYHLWDGVLASEPGGRVHPTQKPVKLMCDMIMDYTKDKGAHVFDPFAGSGTVLMACEDTKRVCMSCEIMPEYCDAIIARYQERTGKKAELIKV